jgi:ribosome-binding protein aMBF1 (putative translation factor)
MTKSSEDLSSLNSSSSVPSQSTSGSGVMDSFAPEVRYREELGFRILQKRQAKGWVVRDLANKLDLSISYMTQVEAGQKNISAFLLWRIESILGRINTRDIK